MKNWSVILIEKIKSSFISPEIINLTPLSLSLENSTNKSNPSKVK